MLESNDLIRDINCNDSNYATLNVENLKINHSNYKLVVYKNFNTMYWNKNSSLCPYWEISPVWRWKVRSVDYRKESDVNWERMSFQCQTNWPTNFYVFDGEYYYDF